MLTLVLTRKQTIAVNFINGRGWAHILQCDMRGWCELESAGYCYRDGDMYRAHETYEAPGEPCEPDALGRTSEAADWQFEDTQWHKFEDGTLQL